jgi:amidase
MTRRDILRLAAAGGAGAISGAGAIPRAAFGDDAPGTGGGGPTRPTTIPGFEWDGAAISDLRQAIASGRATAVSLTQAFLDRIAAVDKNGPALNSIIELNPDALAIARDLDGRGSAPAGPLHGLPILIKDNLDTHDRMTTTAGSLALAGSIAPQDSFVVERLRAAGAVIIGKTNLSEWANFRGEHSTSGWSGRGGLTRNPHALDRNPSGSSSGSAAAVAAGLCAAAIGTETDGSIISPSAACGVVGIKPTVGLVSRSGIIPISQSQDTAGPIARSVTDAAIVLSAIAGPDPRDAATERSKIGGRGTLPDDYTQYLTPDGLRGARIGVARQFFNAASPAAPVLEASLRILREQGATLIDPVDMPSLGKLGDSEFEVLLYEFKAGLNDYLAALGPGAPVHTLAEIIEFNGRNASRELLYFGQEILVKAQARGALTEKSYLEALEKCRRFSRDEGIDAAMDSHQLDAIVAPAGGPAGKTDLIYGDRDIGGSASAAAIAGYPNITVPAGQVMGLPIGFSFFGGGFSEGTLLKLAFAFEQATKAFTPPRFLETVG